MLIRKTMTIIFIPKLRFSPQHSVINKKKNVHRAQTFAQTRTKEGRGEGGAREFFPFLQIQQKDLNPQENETKEQRRIKDVLFGFGIFSPPDL